MPDYYEQTRVYVEKILIELKPLYDKLVNDKLISVPVSVNVTQQENLQISDRSIINKIAEHTIDKYYSMLIDALGSAANSTMSKTVSKSRNHWWTEELNCLKNDSIFSHNMWKDAGRPRSGPIYEKYRNDKLKYKLRIKEIKSNSELEISNDLHDALMSKDINSFWKTWNLKFKNKSKQCWPINGKTDEREIVQEFEKYFENVCQPNSNERFVQLKLEFLERFTNYVGDHFDANKFFSVELVSLLIAELKTGKAPGPDGLTVEHLLHCHPSTILVITYLCNLILLSGHVPPQFGFGIIHPIPKGSCNSKCLNVSDFRGITISPIVSKIFEKCILSNFGEYFFTSDNQFGFKSSCSQDIYSLKSVINHYVSNDSTVSMCTLDLAKAFDKVNCFSLFCKLIDRKLPVNIICLLYDLYKNACAIVKWNGVFSDIIQLSAGVRQGGVLSPILFGVYVNSIILSLQESGLGCHVNKFPMSVFMFADDLVLLSGSITDLQCLINICVKELNKIDMLINVNKSKCVRIEKNVDANCVKLTVDSKEIIWDCNITYLGIHFKTSNKLTIDLKSCRAKFYRSFNDIYSKIHRSSETVILSLVKSFCLPGMLYGLEAIDLNATMQKSLDKPLQRAFGKIFKTYNSNVIAWCMYYFNIWPLRFEWLNRKLKFLHNLGKSENSCIAIIFAQFTVQEINVLIQTVNITQSDSPSEYRNKIWDCFVTKLK
ncbi:MAG: reverse transcriptase family protein [Oscillospiraceae bacterium]